MREIAGGRRSAQDRADEVSRRREALLKRIAGVLNVPVEHFVKDAAASADQRSRSVPVV